MLHGTSLPDANLWAMQLAMLPEDVRKETRDKTTTLNTTHAVLDGFRGELEHYQDSNLSRIQDKPYSKTLQRARPHPIHHVHEPPRQPAVDCQTEIQKLEKLKEELEATVNAFAWKGSKGSGKGARCDGGKGSRLFKPDAAWEDGACWHCGKSLGGRRQGNLPNAIIMKHGSLPKDYEGAYEKDMRELGNTRLVAIGLNEAQQDAHEIVAAFAQAQAAAPSAPTCERCPDEHPGPPNCPMMAFVDTD